jgi:hypothetical protein
MDVKTFKKLKVAFLFFFLLFSTRMRLVIDSFQTDLGLETDEDAKVNINDDRTSKFLSQHKSNVSVTQSPLKKLTTSAVSTSASASTTTVVKAASSQNTSDTITKEKKETKSKSNTNQKTAKKKNKKSKDADDDDGDNESVPSQEGIKHTLLLNDLFFAKFNIGRNITIFLNIIKNQR